MFSVSCICQEVFRVNLTNIPEKCNFILKRDMTVMGISFCLYLWNSVCVSLCFSLCLSSVSLELDDTVKWAPWHGGLRIPFYKISLLIVYISRHEISCHVLLWIGTWRLIVLVLSSGSFSVAFDQSEVVFWPDPTLGH